VPRGCTEIEDFRDNERLRLSNHLTPRVKAVSSAKRVPFVRCTVQSSRSKRHSRPDVVAFENLKHIGERISNASKFQQWAFNKLQELTEYKPEEYGILVDEVKPQYTSQRCSHSECGFTHENNRDGDEFEFLKCGKELHADYNTARNAGWRLVQHWLKSGAGRANCQVALKSGMLNANGEFTSATSRG
jgi:putative transposase